VLRINALGRLVVLGEHGPILGSAAQPRRMALLAVIARAGARGVTRMKVVRLLWPDSDEDHGRAVLSKALSALRRDLGAEDVFLGTNNDLRLNPAVVSSDLDEFDAAVAVGQMDQAASLYVGPFLDGFRVAGATDFEQWAATERSALERTYVSTLGELARGATARGHHTDAARWWGKLTAYEPLNTRHATGLMRALVAAGEPRAALQHARMYELLLAESLDVPADRDVITLAEQIRAGVSAGGSSGVATPVALGDPPPAMVDPAPVAPAPIASNGRAVRSRVWSIAAALVGAIGLLAAGVWFSGRVSTARGPAIALGRIIDHRAGATDDLSASVIDALTSNLVRDGAVRVVSIDRAREVLISLSSGGDLEGALLAAARSAGATELVEGGLYPAGDGLRLDLRRTDLASGTLRAVRSVSGTDPLVLADSAATHLMTAMGAAPSRERSSSVSTRSYPAHRHYDAGLRAYYQQGDPQRAAREFDAAVAADSAFAMAVYYGALATDPSETTSRHVRFRRAAALADRAPDRERLTILAHWAHVSSLPALSALADTLVTRFPHEPDGHLFTALGLMSAGRFLDARVPLERAIALDAASLDGSRPRCVACDALTTLIAVYLRTDSLVAADRTARAWVRLAPASALARARLDDVLARQTAPRTRGRDSSRLGGAPRGGKP